MQHTNMPKHIKGNAVSSAGSDMQDETSNHKTTSGLYTTSDNGTDKFHHTPLFFSLLTPSSWNLGSLSVFSSGLNVSTNKLRPTKRQTLEGICYGLSRLNSEPMRNAPNTIFGLQELMLPIKLLGGAKFALVTPPPTPGRDECKASEKKDVNGHEAEDPFITLLPASCQKVSEKASPLGLVPKLLPPGLISQQARYVGSSFWTWLCIVDDLTETQVGEDWKRTEEDLLRVFGPDYQDASKYHDYDSDCVKVSHALRKVIETTIIGSKEQRIWRDSFNAAVCEVMIGFREERPLIESESITMQEWMRLRVITISARPFFILARADVGLPATVSSFGNPLDPVYPSLIASGEENHLTTIRRVECLLQTILGLQNDILGWEKDSVTNNPLSAIQILIKQGVHQAIAVNDVISVHNSLIYDCVAKAQQVWVAPTDRRNIDSTVEKHNRLFRAFWAVDKKEVEGVRKYLHIIVGFAHGMAHWMAVSKRYLA